MYKINESAELKEDYGAMKILVHQKSGQIKTQVNSSKKFDK